MRIAQISPLWLEVPPQAYGGTEYIVSLLTEELIRRGHEVTLFATANSKTKAQLIPIWPKGLFNDKSLRDEFAVLGLLNKEVFLRRNDFDIIHDHSEFSIAPLFNVIKTPIVSTIHGIFSEEKNILFKHFPNVNYVAISKDHQRSAPGVHIAKTIYHGIPFEKYQFNNQPEDYLLWLSNIAPDKGLGNAIEIAKASGERLLIAGPIFSKNADYFEYRIKPFIDGKQIQFVGEADLEKKVQLFKNAKAFLFPIFGRQEPFGLVVIEAMACGTPVIAADCGSMKELVVDGVTGFIVHSNEEAVQKIKEIGTVSRLACRRHVIKRFSVNRMVNHYEKLYQSLVEKTTKFKSPFSYEVNLVRRSQFRAN